MDILLNPNLSFTWYPGCKIDNNKYTVHEMERIGPNIKEIINTCNIEDLNLAEHLPETLVFYIHIPGKNYELYDTILTQLNKLNDEIEINVQPPKVTQKLDESQLYLDPLYYEQIIDNLKRNVQILQEYQDAKKEEMFVHVPPMYEPIDIKCFKYNYKRFVYDLSLIHI